MSYLKSALIFLIGVIVTIALTKFSDKILPNEPTLIKEISDTIRVVHEYKTTNFEPIEADSSIAVKQINSKGKVSKLDMTRDLTENKKELKYLRDMRASQDLVDSEIVKLKSQIKKSNERVYEGVYNEIIPFNRLFSVFKGYTVSGQTSNFEFTCPSDKNSDFVDLKLRFFDNKLIERIACLYVTVSEIKQEDQKEISYQLFEQSYKVRDGLNLIRIRNYMKQPNTNLIIGYFLKSDTQKQYPKLEKVSCSF